MLVDNVNPAGIATAAKPVHTTSTGADGPSITQARETVLFQILPGQEAACAVMGADAVVALAGIVKTGYFIARDT